MPVCTVMPGLGVILLTVIALVAVALIAWILAAGVESGLRHHQEKKDETGPRSADPADSDR